MFNERAELLDVYRSTPQTLRALVQNLPEAVAREGGTGEDAWSIVEVVCHLRDAEDRAFERVRRMRDEEQPFLPGYDPAQLAESSGYRGQSLAEALEAFATLRASQVAALNELDDAGWQRSGIHEEEGAITIQQLTAHMAAHDAVHLAQLARRVMAAQAR